MTNYKEYSTDLFFKHHRVPGPNLCEFPVSFTESNETFSTDSRNGINISLLKKVFISVIGRDEDERG